MSTLLRHPAVRRVGLVCALVLEPCLHALGLPHPEGLSGLLLSHLAQEG